MRLLNYNNKKARSKIIAQYILEAEYRGAVCFSCGFAAQCLREEGVRVIEIGPKGILSANKWFLPSEIRRLWPDYLDSTSGHLPLWMMWSIAEEMRRDAALALLADEAYRVPTGSGETVTCLRLAFPHITFMPIYDVGEGTKHHPGAPLNGVVKAMTKREG